MPNPKAGTVTFDVGKAVRDAKAGKLDTAPTVAPSPSGDRQEELRREDVLENYATVVEEIVRAKPSAAKGGYIRSITLTSSTGPGVRVDPPRTRHIAEELEEEPSQPALRRPARRRRQPAALRD